MFVKGVPESYLEWYRTLYPTEYIHVFVLCFVYIIVIFNCGFMGIIYPYLSVTPLALRHTPIITPVPVKQPCQIWVKSADKKSQQNTTKHERCVQFLRRTVCVVCAELDANPFAGTVIIDLGSFIFAELPLELLSVTKLTWNFIMMTSSNGNIFRITGHLCGEFTGHRWIPRSNGQWLGTLMFSLICD